MFQCGAAQSWKDRTRCGSRRRPSRGQLSQPAGSRAPPGGFGGRAHVQTDDGAAQLRGRRPARADPPRPVAARTSQAGAVVSAIGEPGASGEAQLGGRRRRGPTLSAGRARASRWDGAVVSAIGAVSEAQLGGHRPGDRHARRIRRGGLSAAVDDPLGPVAARTSWARGRLGERASSVEGQPGELCNNRRKRTPVNSPENAKSYAHVA